MLSMVIIIFSASVFAGKSSNTKISRKQRLDQDFANFSSQAWKYQSAENFRREILTWPPILKDFAAKYVEVRQALETDVSTADDWLPDCLLAFINNKEISELNRLKALIKLSKLKIFQKDFYYVSMIYLQIYQNRCATDMQKNWVKLKLSKLYVSENINHLKKTNLDMNKVLDIILNADSLSPIQAEAILLFNYRFSRHKICYTDSNGVEFTIKNAAFLLDKIIENDQISPLLRAKAQFEIIDLLAKGRIDSNEIKIREMSLNYLTSIKLLNEMVHDENVNEMLKIKVIKLRDFLHELINGKEFAQQSAQVLIEMMHSKE